MVFVSIGFMRTSLVAIFLFYLFCLRQQKTLKTIHLGVTVGRWNETIAIYVHSSTPASKKESKLFRAFTNVLNEFAVRTIGPMWHCRRSRCYYEYTATAANVTDVILSPENLKARKLLHNNV